MPDLEPYQHYYYGNEGKTASSQARAVKLGAVSVIFRVTESNLFRDAKGRFTVIQREWDRVNRRTARNIQQGVVADTYASLDRPSVSTRRLRAAYLAPGQVQPAPGGFQYGFGVFDYEKLDKSDAKYWRLIEFGTKATLGGRWTGKMVDSEGVPLYGRWGGSITGYYTNRWGRVARAGPPWNVEAGKLRVAPKSVREQLIRPSTGRPPKIPVRRKHIRPKAAFDRNWEKYGSDVVAKRLFAVVREELQGIR
jgi:hypothetical protein